MFLVHWFSLLFCIIAWCSYCTGSLSDYDEGQKRLHFRTKDNTNISIAEYNALYDFYNETGGTSWVWTASLGNPWVFAPGANPCINWQGIMCITFESSLYVAKITLASMGLSGSLPASIGQFSQLQVLTLSGNALFGELPDTMANCTKLIVLNLNSNNFNTTFPAVLSGMPSLQDILLRQNHFHGDISESFKIGPQLHQLDLSINRFTGCPPLPGNYANVTGFRYLILNSNIFHCTLPEEYAALTGLVNLHLESNFFYGSIPTAYSNLTKLTLFSVITNDLTGPIGMLGAMQQLVHFYVSDNLFTGHVPPEIVTMMHLTNVDLSVNLLSGPIPTDFGQLAQLIELYTYENLMTGTLPASLGNCTPMEYFSVDNNFYTGTVPASLGQLTQVAYFELSSNKLSGTLPPELGSMTKMYLFAVDLNALSGTIPPSYSAMTALLFLVAGSNHLSGPLSDALAAGWSQLYQLDLSANRLSGSLPTALGGTSQLQYCNLFDNVFTGTLPASFGSLQYLEFFFLYENSLTGSIPASFGNLYYMMELTMGTNYLTGSIPESVGALPYMQFFYADANMLTGTLPRSLSQGYFLLTLTVDNNHLTGTLDGVFNASMQVSLLTVVMSNNQLSGTLPAELFRLPKLNSFGAVSNCFHGQVPAQVCGATSLVTLALDGLSSSPACRDTLLPGLSRSYVILNSLDGTIPACLFDLPILTTLHLSGNGFTGPLPDVPLNSYLVDLSLSHNVLTGTIPQNMQERTWYNLDLAFNRISGSLLPGFQSQHRNRSFFAHLGNIIDENITQANTASTLALETNRLSGRIPSVLQHTRNVSILGSNVFTCDLTETNLPQFDDGRNNYQCGSDSFNVPFYLWLALLCVTLCAAWAVRRYQETIQRYVGIEYALTHVHKWRRVLEDHPQVLGGNRLRAYRAVLQLGQGLCRLGARCAAFMVLVLMPLYAACSHYRGTLLHQYAWTLSAAYLTGWLPAILMLVLLTPLVTFAAYSILVFKTRSVIKGGNTNIEKENVTPSMRVKSTAAVVMIYALFLLINLVVVVGVNTAYVLVAIYGQSAALFPAQLLLSCFKLLWNRFFSVYLIRWTARLKALVGVSAPNSDTEDIAEGEKEEDLSSESQFVSLQMFVALLNNVAVPCLVVVGISPSCFYNVFVAAPKVTAIYTYEACADLLDQQCKYFLPGTFETSYDPPFNYSYQCSSSFITYYAPTFVLLCLMRAFASPLLQFSLYHLHRRSAPGTRWNALLDSVLLPSLKSIVPGQRARRDPFKPFFDANQLLLSLFTYLGLMLTFGAVFPPVALAILVTLFAVFFFNKLKASRFLCRAVEQQQLDYVDVVERESARAGFLPVLERAAWMLVTVSCWFYTLFLFDTLGDAVGFAGAYWVLIVMPLMPLVLYCLYQLYILVGPRVGCTASSLTDGPGAVEDKRRNEEAGSTGDVAERGGTLNVLLQQSNAVELTRM